MPARVQAQTPVLFLTARDAVVDRIAGFDAPGGDALTSLEPFAPRPSSWRSCPVARPAPQRLGLARSESGGLQPRTAHPFDPGDASRGRAMTPTEFRLLAKLFAASGQAVRRRDLVRARLAALARSSARTHDSVSCRHGCGTQAWQADRPGARNLHRAPGWDYRL